LLLLPDFFLFRQCLHIDLSGDHFPFCNGKNVVVGRVFPEMIAGNFPRHCLTPGMLHFVFSTNFNVSAVNPIPAGRVLFRYYHNALPSITGCLSSTNRPFRSHLPWPTPVLTISIVDMEFTLLCPFMRRHYHTHTLLLLLRSDRLRRFSKYSFPPGPQAFGALDRLMPGAIAGGWICLSGAKCVFPVCVCVRRITLPCFRAAILHTIMPE